MNILEAALVKPFFSSKNFRYFQGLKVIHSTIQYFKDFIGNKDSDDMVDITICVGWNKTRKALGISST